MAHTKIGLGMLVTALALLVSGCKTFTTAPVFYSNNTHYDFIILGEVTYESSTATGFRELLKAARAQYPNCDYVIDIMVDSQTSTTSFFRIIKAFTIYTMRGTAIQYIYKNSDGQTVARPAPTPIPSAQSPVATPVPPASTSAVPPASTSAAAGTTASATPAAPARVSVANQYTVERSDRAERREASGTFVLIRRGDVLSKDTLVRIASGGTLVLTDGSTTITIPENRMGRIADLVTQR